MKQVIVTGANGFVGSALVRKLLDLNIEVVAVSRKKNNIPEHKNLNFISLDLKNIKKLEELLPSGFSPDTFYHFAWDGSAGEKRADTLLQLLNVQWTIDALNTAKSIGCNRFIGAGSIMEKETYDAVTLQGSKPGVGYIYGAAKLEAHCFSKSVSANIGIEHIWGVITNIYGVGELSPRFINSTLRKIINNEPVKFTSGTQNYDFIYIEDAVEAFYKIGLHGKPFCEYMIGSSNPRPLKNFLMEMKEAVCPKKEFIFGDIPFTGTNLALNTFNCEDTERDTGFKAEISFGEGCKKTIEWLESLEFNK